jgi:hypothetical protein
MHILWIVLIIAIGVAFLASIGIPLGVILGKKNTASTGTDASTSSKK